MNPPPLVRYSRQQLLCFAKTGYYPKLWREIGPWELLQLVPYDEHADREANDDGHVKQYPTLLHVAAETGHYPAGTTPEHLAAAVERSSDGTENNGFTAIHVAASRGTLPSGTALEQLTTVRETDTGLTPLHYAAMRGQLRKTKVSSAFLAGVVSIFGTTCLHSYALCGGLPGDATRGQCLGLKDKWGRNVLHYLADCHPQDETNNNFPCWVTAEDLLARDSNEGVTAWEKISPLRLPSVLDAMHPTSHKALKEIANLLVKSLPTTVALWYARELQRLNRERHCSSSGNHRL